MSFRLKTILGVALIEGVLLAVLISGVFSQLFTFSQQQHEDYARVTLTNFAAMSRDSVLGMDLGRLQSLVNETARNPDIVYVRIRDAGKRSLAEAGSLPAADAPRDVHLHDVADGIYDIDTNIVVGGQILGRVELGISLSRLDATFEKVHRQSWLLAAGEMGLVALFSLLLGTYLTRQLKSLQDGAEHLAKGELGYQIKVQGSDEISAAAESFNSMSLRLLRNQLAESEFKEKLRTFEEDERQRLETLVAKRTAALHEAGVGMRTLIENMPAIVVRYDPLCRAIFVSPQFEKTTGIPAQQFLGLTFDQISPGSEAEKRKFNAMIRNVLETGKPAETELHLTTPLGERIHQVRMVAERDAAQIITGVLSVGIDITDTRRGEARLALMSHAMNLVTEAALLINEQGRIFYANKGASDMLGYPMDELIQMGLEDLREDFDPARWAKHWHDLRAQHSMIYETVNRHRDGRLVQVEVNATYFEVDGNGYDLALGRDISNRKQLEAAREATLWEAENLARIKSEFLANMSHEIRTPLNAVLGMAQLGIRSSRGRRVQSQFAAIQDAGQLLLSLVNDILDFSKIDAGKLTLDIGTVETGALIDRVIDLTVTRAFAKELDFSVDEAADLPLTFSGDFLRLTQVLVNLLSNAVKFTEVGGISLAVRREQAGLCFRVSDTGIGMNEEQLSRLFTPFEQADGSTTRRFGGTGLGLAISKRLVDLMGGEIVVSSRPGAGTTFTVSIPVDDLPPPPTRVAAGNLWLTGPGCVLQLVSALPDWGIEVLIGGINEALTGAEGPLVFAYSALTRKDSQTEIRAILASKRQVITIAPPGGMHNIPSELLDQVDLLDWPPRARHIHRLMTTKKGDKVIPSTPERRKRLSGVRILIAEDNDLNRTILQDLLTFEGARVVSVENGRQLVDRVQQGPSDFDIVVTDVQMPEMDGYEATREIHALAASLPVIGLTAHVLGEERERCMSSGMVAHVGKPTRLDDLVQTLRENLGTHVGNLRTADALSVAATADDVDPAIQSTVTPAEFASVDWDALIEDFQDRPDLVRKGCELLLSNHVDSANQLRQLARTGSPQDLGKQVHTLKGMAGTLHASRTRTQALVVEEALRSGATDVLADVELLAEEIEQLLTEVTARLNDPRFLQ